MSRLLFAAARGARIQARLFEFDEWANSPGFRFKNLEAYRIHPDDEHLQYGPISSALRERAEWGGYPTTGLPYTEGYFNFQGDEHWEFDTTNALHRSLFLLILAEALADEGL